MDITGKRIVITGGSSGIGLALARILGSRGGRLLLTGRRVKALEAAGLELNSQGIEVHVCAGDVATEDGRANTIRSARQCLGGIDILVNNAGGVLAGRLEMTSEAEIRTTVEVDLVGPILLIRAALPDLRQSGQSLIVKVASGIALIGMPFYATYAAAKAGLARFSEALRRELNGDGIHVLIAHPTATDTPMMATSQAGLGLGFVREPPMRSLGQSLRLSKAVTSRWYGRGSKGEDGCPESRESERSR